MRPSFLQNKNNNRVDNNRRTCLMEMKLSRQKRKAEPLLTWLAVILVEEEQEEEDRSVSFGE